MSREREKSLNFFFSGNWDGKFLQPWRGLGGLCRMVPSVEVSMVPTHQMGTHTAVLGKPPTKSWRRWRMNETWPLSSNFPTSLLQYLLRSYLTKKHGKWWLCHFYFIEFWWTEVYGLGQNPEAATLCPDIHLHPLFSTFCSFFYLISIISFVFTQWLPISSTLFWGNIFCVHEWNLLVQETFPFPLSYKITSQILLRGGYSWYCLRLKTEGKSMCMFKVIRTTQKEGQLPLLHSQDLPQPRSLSHCLGKPMSEQLIHKWGAPCPDVHTTQWLPSFLPSRSPLAYPHSLFLLGNPNTFWAPKSP